jgi:hypothetical protein
MDSVAGVRDATPEALRDPVAPPRPP